MFPYQVTPDIFSDTVSWFDSDASFPATNYVIGYLTGAMIYGISLGWSVNLNNWVPFNGFIITDGASNQVPGPGIANGTGWGTQALCEAANAGLYVVYEHVGGQIGMYLNDNPYSDNEAGSPNPTFGLLGSYSFSASVTTLSCANRSSTLTWATAGAVSVAIDQGIGTVSASGSLTVYPTTTTTYTLTVTYSDGVVTTAQVTVTVTGQVCVPTLDGNLTYFNGGASFATGVYYVNACGGGFQWNKNSPTFGFNSNDRAPTTSQAFKITDGQSTIDGPGDYEGFSSVAASTAANNPSAYQIFNHQNPGPIGMYLELDSYEGVAPGVPAPGYQISGPLPEIAIVASPNPINAGGSSTLSWNVLNPTGAVISINQGIGTVSATGTQSVSPTVTTRYTITATILGLSITSYVDVVVRQPQPLTGITAVGACAGVIQLGWTEPMSPANEVLIERSATGGGIGFTQIQAIGNPNTAFNDTPPTAGATYYYRFRTTDGTNLSQYSLEFSAASLLTPAAPASFAIALGIFAQQSAFWTINGLPDLTWNPAGIDPSITSLSVYRSTVANAEGLVPIQSGVAPSVGKWFDTSAQYGVQYFYKVAYVNTCSVGVFSPEITITPQLNGTGTGTPTGN